MRVQIATDEDVTEDDAAAVTARLEAMAKASTHGGYDPTMTSDPYLVSKARNPTLAPSSCFRSCPPHPKLRRTKARQGRRTKF